MELYIDGFAARGHAAAAQGGRYRFLKGFRPILLRQSRTSSVGRVLTSPLSKLGLGAAQFRLDGPSPAAVRGRSPEAEVGDILAIAARSNISVFDAATSSAWGESVIGERMPQPCPFRVALKAARMDRGADYVEDQARAALQRLRLRRADAVVVPIAGDLFGPYGAEIWTRLQALRDEGLFAKLGVSVYASDDPLGVARRFKPDIVQAPASLLDQRLLVDGTLAELAAMGVEVQMRSIFLQGLLFLPPDRVPGPLKGAASRLSRVRRMIAEGRSDPLQAALGFALSRPEAQAVIVGVATAPELQAVVAAAQSPPPDLDWDEMALDDPVALDPRRWVA
jgi:aryl-alcohol dehydrogenase-like predicted oxidoreductase